MSYRPTDLYIYGDLNIAGDAVCFAPSNSVALGPNDLYVSSNVYASGDVITGSTTSNNVMGTLYAANDIFLYYSPMPVTQTYASTNMSLKQLIVAANNGIDPGPPYRLSQIANNLSFSSNVNNVIFPSAQLDFAPFKGSTYINSQTAYTLTNMGATGATGPTAVTYSSPLSGWVTLQSGIQYLTVPSSGNYVFTVAGAGLQNTNSLNAVNTGYGVVLTANYPLVAGQVIGILVGQQGLVSSGLTGGCGGTYVCLVTGAGSNATATPLFVAGGAAGVGGEADVGGNATVNATSAITGNNGVFWSSGAQGGTGGVGPLGSTAATNSAYSWADGGAGFSGNGSWSSRFGTAAGIAKSFTNGGVGSTNTASAAGGFGGGGCAGLYGKGAGGGGGGYGGGGAGGSHGSGAGGGGGGSYDITGLYSASVTNVGMGYVVLKQTSTYVNPFKGNLPPVQIPSTVTTTTISGITYTFSSTGLNGNYVWNGTAQYAWLDGSGQYSTTSPYTYGGTASTPGFPNGSWWQVTTSTPTLVSAYSLKNILAGGLSEWYLLGSNNNGASFSIIDHQAYTWTVGATISTPANNRVYKTYRFVVVAATGQTSGAALGNFYLTLS